MLKYSSFPTGHHGRIFEIRSLRGLTYAYVPILGRPDRPGARLPYKAISSVLHHLSPF